MPIGKIQRKPSIETITSIGMDSSLDSRLSSVDVPKMELLKVNYVHQCKEALMPKLDATAPLSTHYQRQPAALPSYKYAAFKKLPTSSTQTAKVTRVSFDGTTRISSNCSQPLPPPPPTVESWQYLQSKQANKLPTHDSDASCGHSVSSCSDTDNTASTATTDAKMSSRGCERSNSWDYRTKVSTHDIRRDLARAGVKSRADRIARIEKSECDHRRELAAKQRASLPLAQKTRTTASAEVVSKINLLFEKANQQHKMDHRNTDHSPPTPPQPQRAAPVPIKEPNMRRRNYANVVLRVKDNIDDCLDCSCSSSGTASGCGSSPVTARTRNSVVAQQRTDQGENKHLSRIPKPIYEHGQRSSALLYREANEQLQRRIKQLFEQEGSRLQQQHNFAELGPKSSRAEVTKIPTKVPELRNDCSIGEDHAKRLLRHTRPNTAGHQQKARVERIHIRKKRQPLLIINQLTSDKLKSPDDGQRSLQKSEACVERSSCGYQNCNVVNCPMSSQQQSIIEDNLKRLSLESNSDSGVSSSTDAKEQTKENNMKNIIKCSDCGEQAADTKDHAYNKRKLSPQTSLVKAPDKLKQVEDNLSGKQIKIHVGKTQHVDPNDVQNFAKKNLTKATTDELLTAALSNSVSKTLKAKQCNIENDLKKNGEQQKNKHNNNFRQSTTIKIDDDWVQETNDATVTYLKSATRKPINASGTDNAVKIFVRSSTACSNRASLHSTNSYASSSASSTSSAASVPRLEADEEQDCRCKLTTQSGIFFHQSAKSCTRSGAASPIPEDSCISCTTASTGPREMPQTLGCDPVGGVFWNNPYFYNEGEPVDDQCCCNLSSCDEDNCSFYDGDDCSVIAVDSPRDNCDNYCNKRYLQQKKDEHRRQLQLLRNSGAGELLIRNKKLLRKTDILNELRPRSMDGVADSGVSMNGDAGSSPDSGEQQNTEERRLKRGHVLTELLETEKVYVSEMHAILEGYYEQMKSEEMMHLVPASLQGKEDVLFGNLQELFTFHSEIFLKDLQNCISTTELVALCFVQRRDTFYRLYSFYCQNIPRSERLRETLVDTHLFLQECQKRLGHKLPLGAYLLKPVQRITKYQLLLKDLLRFSDSSTYTKEVQKALDCMLIVLKCVNDSMHQVAITGFPNDLLEQGELLLQDSFQVLTEAKKDIRLRIKPQQRHIFLYQKSMLFCKQTSKPGHNKSTYQFKHHLKMSQIGLTESVRGDTKRFEVWLQGRQEVYTLQAPTIEIKNKWVAEIKRVLLNQLEELKGEKIKQYGLNQRGLRQTTSWDTPNILFGVSQRAISCDASSESSNRNSNCSSSGDDNIWPTATTSATAANSGVGPDKELPEACGGWSSDYSNSEDEVSLNDDNSTPGSKYVALADYVAMGHSEVSMREGDTVEMLKVGCAGWWFVRNLDANAEGWTPAAYLESLHRKSSRNSSRNQERTQLN